MARTPNVKIVEWGTPPEAEPTGWDAVRVELERKPGKWANVGEMTTATARKVQTERLPESEGFEFRIIPGKSDDRRLTVWVRKTETEDVPSTETTSKARGRRATETETETPPAS